MADEWPKIVSRRTTRVSPWVEIIAREVEFGPGEPAQLYHALGQHDYLSIVARTPDGGILIVRQYRPAVEGFTWELPAGLLEPGEDPEAACARELLEETGHPARKVHTLGVPAPPCTGRFSNLIHSFFVETDECVAGFTPEPGMTVERKSPAELVAMIKAGAFVHHLHLGTLLLAEVNNHLVLPR